MNAYLRKTMIIILVFIMSGISSAQASQLNPIDEPSATSIDSAYPAGSWVTELIDSNDSSGSDISIAFDPNHGEAPWVSYHNQTNGSLMVSHYVGPGLGNCGTDDKWFCEQVDQVDNEDKGYSTSIDVFPDKNPDPLFSTWKVGVSYFDATHKSLKFAEYRCSLINPCAWKISTVDSSGNPDEDAGRYSSMKFNPDGIPYIAYDNHFIGLAGYDEALKRAFYDPMTGNCGDNNAWQCTMVDSNRLGLRFHPSLDFNYPGHDFIAYNHYDLDNNQIYQDLYQAWYVGNGEANCGTNNDWECYELVHVDGQNVGLFPSVHATKNAIYDVYRVAYYDATNGKLDYAYNVGQSEGNCGPGNTYYCIEIDDIGINREWVSISLALDSDFKPMIAYSDASPDLTSPELKVAEPHLFGNCGPTISFPISAVFHTWWCGYLSGGNMFSSAAQFVSLGINTYGKAMIAYSQFQLVNTPGFNLDVAFQPEWVFLPTESR